MSQKPGSVADDERGNGNFFVVKAAIFLYNDFNCRSLCRPGYSS